MNDAQSLLEVELTYPPPRPVLDLNPWTWRTIAAYVACFFAVLIVTVFCLADVFHGTEILFAPALPVEYRFGATLTVGVFVMGNLFFIAYSMWSELQDEKRVRALVACGTAVRGVLKQVTAKSGKWTVSYEFPVGSDNETRRQTGVWKGNCTFANEGGELTILYDPADPTNSTIYILNNVRAYIEA